MNTYTSWIKPWGITPFIENQESRVFATYSLNPLYTSFFCNIMQYKYTFNDENTSDNMCT